MTDKTQRQTIKAATECMAMNLLDYDVRDGEDLPAGGIAQAVRNGEATAKEIVAWFSAELERCGMEPGPAHPCQIQRGMIFALTKIGDALGMEGDYTISDIEERIAELRRHTDGGR